MKILAIGDSLTDMRRVREGGFDPFNLGLGYPFFVEGVLATEAPGKYQIINRGIGGNRLADVLTRLKADCINLEPDVISILLGTNDAFEIIDGKSKEEKREFVEEYELIYKLILDDIKDALPNVKVILLEPIFLHGPLSNDKYDNFLVLKDYSLVAQKLCKEYGCAFVSLQNKFEELAGKYGDEKWLADGIHTSCAGAKLIADEWLKVFKDQVVGGKF